MQKRTRTCDTKCFDLAEYFLSDGSGEENFTHDEAYELACDIQQAVEDWFAGRAAEPFPGHSHFGG